MANPPSVTHKLAATSLALLMTLSACSGPVNSGDAESLPPLEDADGFEKGKEAARKKSGEESSKQRADENDGDASEASGSSGDGSSAGTRLPGRSGPGVSTVRDGVGDQEGDGDVPPWVDLTGGAVRASGGALVATAAFASSVPARMPDENHVSHVAIQLQLPKDDAYLYAEGRPDGWRAYLSLKKKGRELPPESFSVTGREMSWRVPWAVLGDPKRVDWSLHLSWTQTTVLRVNYAFDSAPDSGTERLRRR